MTHFGQNTREMTHQAQMTQNFQQHQQSEVPHFKVFDLLKRLACKDDVLQHCYNENQHLKMMMHQIEARNFPIGGTMRNEIGIQHAVMDPHGNVCISYQEHKKVEEELKKKNSEIDFLKERRRKDSSESSRSRDKGRNNRGRKSPESNSN